MNYRFYDLFLGPVITEKAMSLSENGKYVFGVQPDAKKRNIKIAVEKVFSVKVTKVNVLNIAGKRKRFKGTMGKRKDIRKAIVTLETGQSIDFMTKR